MRGSNDGGIQFWQSFNYPVREETQHPRLSSSMDVLWEFAEIFRVDASYFYINPL